MAKHESLILEPCPLCRRSKGMALDAESPSGGRYYHCPACDLIYLTSAGILSPADERARYLTHENSPENAGYVRMLTRFMERAVLPFASGGQALDLGCGPGPVLADLLSGRGFSVALYDPYFAPDRNVLEHRYHLVTATEVLEHVTDAADLWTLLGRLLQPGGILAMTTRFHPGPGDFDPWWYRRDPTHIRFYSPRTLGWVAAQHGWKVLFLDDRDTITLRRK